MWKQKIKEYMNSNRNMENLILLCPDYISSKITIGKRHTTNGTYYKISYYQGFEKKHFSGYLSDEQLHTTLEEINKAKNNITDIFKISKTDLTPDIIRRFRYVEPILEYDHCEVLIDPYILGLWLGDGDSDNLVLTNVDIPVINAWKSYATIFGHDITIYGRKERTDGMEYNTEIETSFVGRYAIVKSTDEESITSYSLDTKPDKIIIISNSEGKYECNYCKTIYERYHSLYMHLRNRVGTNRCFARKNEIKENFKKLLQDPISRV